MPAARALAAVAAIDEIGGEVGWEIGSESGEEIEREIRPDAFTQEAVDAGTILKALLDETLDTSAAGSDAGAAGEAVLWREPTPRLFIGEAGSLTCAHTDIVPQVEMAHGLCGLKLMGISSHEATNRLLEKHGAVHGAERADDCFDDEGEQDDYGDEDGDSNDDEGDVFATRVPTDRELSPLEASLLEEVEVTKVILRAGDLLAFSSGALHFASNGADSLNAALYHGMVTRGVMPRLCEAAAAEGDGEDDPGWTQGRGRYSDHWSAAELIREIASQQSPTWQ